MKIVLLASTLLFSSFLLLSCKNDNPVPPGDQPQISLTLEDASCTEAWIKLTTANISLPADVELLKDDNPVKTISLISADTILYVDSLLPNHTYKYQSVIQSVSPPAGEAGQKSNLLVVTTMDTTSHNFTWQSWTFGGQAGSCTLYDVAIISENDIWAVGEIYLLDTLGQPDPLPYNAIHWDGNNWTTKRVQTVFRNNLITVPLTGIYAFSSNDIWMVGSLPIHGDGQNWIMYDLRSTVDPNLSLAKAWGENTNDMYFVGNSGSIAHYQNGSWGSIESGMDVDLLDIYGTTDGKTVWIAGYEDFKPTVLLKISNSIIQSVFSSRDYLFIFDSKHISGGIGGVWTNNDNFVYLTTWYSLYRKSVDTDSSEAEALKPGSPVTFFGLRSRGTNINNIFTIGSRNVTYHFNGMTFENYEVPADVNVTYYSLDVKTNVAVLCGQKYENGISDKAIITLIK